MRGGVSVLFLSLDSSALVEVLLVVLLVVVLLVVLSVSQCVVVAAIETPE